MTIEEDAETLTAAFSGRDLGLLIGKNGQTIDAIQYLANAIVYRGQIEDRKAIVVDASGPPGGRKATLGAAAVRRGGRGGAPGRRGALARRPAVDGEGEHPRREGEPGAAARGG